MNKIVLKAAKSMLLGVAGAAFVFIPNTTQAQDWDVSGFMENVTHYRDDYGLSKVRNTLQLGIRQGLWRSGRDV